MKKRDLREKMSVSIEGLMAVLINKYYFSECEIKLTYRIIIIVILRKHSAMDMTLKKGGLIL